MTIQVSLSWSLDTAKTKSNSFNMQYIRQTNPPKQNVFQVCPHLDTLAQLAMLSELYCSTQRNEVTIPLVWCRQFGWS